MDPMARRRSVRQDPDATDDDLVRAMQMADGQETPLKTGSSVAGKGKKASKKQPKEVGTKSEGSEVPNNVAAEAPEALEASNSEDSKSAVQLDSRLEAASEELQSPESVSPHPFWSERAKLELALAKARPTALDQEALRFPGEDAGLERPADLEERSHGRKEVRIDEEFLEPPYDSPQQEKIAGTDGSGLPKPVSSPQDVTSNVEAEENAATFSGGGLCPVQNEVVPQSDRARSVQLGSQVGDVLEDQALEIAQLRSLVDHLQGALLQAEEGKSYTSSSNQGLEMPPQVPFPCERAHSGPVSVSQERIGLEELMLSGRRPAISSPQPSVGPVQGLHQPVPPVTSMYPPMQLSANPSGSYPEIFPMSSKASVDPFQEVVWVHGQPHRWVRVADKLGLEPIIPTASRERSPSPPPPKSTPPPSPPPYHPAEERMLPLQAPGEPIEQALVLLSGDRQDWSSRLVGDPDGSGSGVHSYQSAESGGVQGHQVGYPQSCAALSPTLSGVGEKQKGSRDFRSLDKQVLLYHLNQIKQGHLTLDQLALAIGNDSAGVPGNSSEHMGLLRSVDFNVHGPGATHEGAVGTVAEHAQLQGLGAMRPGMLGAGAEHACSLSADIGHNGMPGEGAGRNGVRGLGATFTSVQSLEAPRFNMEGFPAACPSVLPPGSGQVPAQHWPPSSGQVPAQHLPPGSGQVPPQHLPPGSGQVPAQHLPPGSGQVPPQHLPPGSGQVPAQHLPPSSGQVPAQPLPLGSGQVPAQHLPPGSGQVQQLPLSSSHPTLAGSGPVIPPNVSSGSGFVSPSLSPIGPAMGVGLAAQAPTMFGGSPGPDCGKSGSTVPILSPSISPPRDSSGPGGDEGAWYVSGGTPRGRGEYEPGDRVFWDLPKLGAATEPNAAVRASDWLCRSALMLRDLSSRSWRWWDRVYEAALKHYHDYQQADPLSRGLLRPDLPEDLRHHTFARLESRAVSMILHAVPESVSSQALATRSLSTVGLLFQILKQYQPGGLGERQELLKSLTDLNQASNAGDAVLILQAWFRHIARARTMQVQLPDGSLLLAALDNMSKPLLAENSQLAFRVSLNRHQLRLDYRADLELVEAYARNLMAEFEVLSLASDSPQSPKKPRMRKAKEKAQAPPPSKDSPITPPSVPLPASQPRPPPPKAPASSKACASWLTDAGCKYGSKCRFVHDMETEALKGRCFACSAKDHWANNCPVRQAERQAEVSGASPPFEKARSGVPRKGGGKGKGGSSVKSVDSAVPGQGDSQSNPSSEAPVSGAKALIVDSPNPTQELAKEVTEVLRSLRLKKLGVVGSVCSGLLPARLSSLPQNVAARAVYGLIDSGATSALRTGSEAEIAAATPVSVQLAVGETHMFANAHGTLLTPDEVQPIIPMAFLPDLGCSMTWSDRGCAVRHPRKGLLPVRLHHHCPELPVHLVLELINEHEGFLERKRALQAQARMAVAAVLHAPAEIGNCPMAWIRSQIQDGQLSMSTQAQWLAKLFPELPQRILERVICPIGFNVDRVPYNRHVRRRLFDPRIPTLLHLFSGAQRWSDCGHVLHVEKERGSDMLSNDVFGMLLQAVLSKGVEGAVGGPPCNTTSACRMADDGGPRQVRSREGPERFGLQRNTAAEQAQVDEASVLWFRTIMLFLLISVVQGPRAFLGLEHPEDPAKWADASSPLQQCPSLWVFPELAYVKELLHAYQANFDQGHFGHPRRKPTSVLTTSWAVYETLAAHRCTSTWQPQASGDTAQGKDIPPSQPPGRYPSATWARWAPGLVRILKDGWVRHCRTSVEALLQYQEDQQAKLQALSPAWQAHVAADHHPYRKDCEICLQAASRDRPHFRQSDSSFYAMSADISGPFTSGKDIGGSKRYFVAFAIRLPVGETFPWRQRTALPEAFPEGKVEVSTPRARTPLPVSGPSTRAPPFSPDPANPVSFADASVHDNLRSRAASPLPVSGSSTRVLDPNPCEHQPDTEEDELLDMFQDVQADSMSEPVQVGLPPPRRVRGKSSPVKADSSAPSSGPHPDLRMEFSRDGVPDLSDPQVSQHVSGSSSKVDPASAPIDFLDGAGLPAESPDAPVLNREFVTLRWAEPLLSRSADNLRLVVMQSVAKCKAFGIPVLRFHSDRAKEFQSAKLVRWLAEQSIHVTKSAPEDPQANGTAESAVKEIKRTARRSLISSGLSSLHWPLAVRQASELLWRSALAHLGCPVRPLLAFGTRVEARSREWLKRPDKQWGPRTLQGRLVGPAPQTPSAYLVLLDDGHLYISSSVHPVTVVADPLAAPHALPPCHVQLRLFRASERDSFLSRSEVASSPNFEDSPFSALRALGPPSPYGGGGLQMLQILQMFPLQTFQMRPLPC